MIGIVTVVLLVAPRVHIRLRLHRGRLRTTTDRRYLWGSDNEWTLRFNGPIQPRTSPQP